MVMRINLKTVLFLAGVLLVVSNPCAVAHTDVTAEQVRDLIDSTNDLTVVDVREPYEYCGAIGHIPGALNYPWNSGVLEARYEELPTDGPVLVVCQSGGRSNAAANFLDSKGFSTVYDMLGGMSAWQWETAPCKYSGGNGTADDPYQIATAADLIALGETPEDYDKHFIITADIDLDPNLPGRKVFYEAVIAPDTDQTNYRFDGATFTGVFDGNAHTIRNLTITGRSYLGLFGQLSSGADISNLGLEETDVNGVGHDIGGLVAHNLGSVIQCYSSGMITGDNYVGGLVGYNYGAVAQCYSTCSVTGNYVVGGLVGSNWGFDVTHWDGTTTDWDGNITDCYSTSVVTGSSYVGGLVGNNVGNMINCYSTGAVMGNEAVGGLVGMNGLQGVMPYPGYIDKSYSLASVRGEILVGGLVGDNRIGDVMQCYSAGGVSGNVDAGGLAGLAGEYSGSVLYSVWDVETSGLSGSAGGVGLTTAEMMDPCMLGLNGFADDPNWVLDPGRDYPRLVWEGTPGQIIPEPEINWLTGRGTSEAPYKIDTSDQLILLGKGPIL
jgi:rhodanese-related sulfurtransferase